MADAIEIASLTKAFGSFVAVSDVTMSVKRGDFMGLLGPNGAGKSTIMKVITGLISPTSGSVNVNGIDCRNHRQAMETVGCVIETPECYPNFTPVEVLTYVGRIRGIGKDEMNDRIKEVLEEVRMWEWRDKPVGKFSKGMRQRVALAQALIPDPEILLLDEPTSGLDPRGMIEVREILAGLKGRDKSLLISTHMLNEVSELCGSVTVIRRGRTVMSGNVREFMRNKGAAVSLEVGVRKNITNEFFRDIGSLQGVAGAEKMDPNTFLLSFSGTFDDREAIVDVIRSHDLGFMTMEEKGTDLESLYMSLTKEDENDDVR